MKIERICPCCHARYSPKKRRRIQWYSLTLFRCLRSFVQMLKYALRSEKLQNVPEQHSILPCLQQCFNTNGSLLEMTTSVFAWQIVSKYPFLGSMGFGTSYVRHFVAVCMSSHFCTHKDNLSLFSDLSLIFVCLGRN